MILTLSTSLAMTLEATFSLSNSIALLGWIALALAPLRRPLAQFVAARAIPVLLGLVYAGLIARFWTESAGGFGSLDGVSALFDHRGLLLAGWLHYLAFDLFVGAWQVREAERVGLPHAAVLPALALTFLFGPIGLLVFLALRAIKQRGLGLHPQGEIS
jgi:hypothetical protein